MEEPGIIKKLDETVVNRIAAGEIIQRPANALKELLENSLDAKCSSIQILLKNGGLKLLQIQDNGTGIRTEDLEIVCERFTTSKLRQFEDLGNIATFGFRGEALASISHVAHLTITTKTSNQQCAYRASYVDGKLKGPPKATAGNQGTTITVEDLFYNVSTRKNALKNPNEEYSKAAEVVSRYAIHNPKVGFTLKKYGEQLFDVRSNSNSTYLENIRNIYGETTAKDLLEIDTFDDKLNFKLHGFISNVNFSSKKQIFILFINNRLVDSSTIKKMLQGVYSMYLPKGAHPFIYLSLKLDPKNVDVNVHPTKHEVHFLHEDAIVDVIRQAFEEKLLGSNTSRVFYTQAKLPTSNVESVSKIEGIEKTPQSKMIRTDSMSQKIDRFFNVTHVENSNFTKEESKQDRYTFFLLFIVSHCYCHYYFGLKPVFKLAVFLTNSLFLSKLLQNHFLNKSTSQLVKINNCVKYTILSDYMKYVITLSYLFLFIFYYIFRREIKLLSVHAMRSDIETSCSAQLRELVSNMTFVGNVDIDRALVQHGTKLYLLNSKTLREELFYQIMVCDFGNFGAIKFEEPLYLYELSLLGLEDPASDWKKEDGEKSVLAESICELLFTKKEMLLDYFSIEINDQKQLCSIPYLLDDYMPDMSRLPHYLLRLACDVNWKEEQPCFEGICRETASFYSF
uniref:DNA_mis_repair domain-containing protein n=1 Tax=Rhodnius prolixus TaxID=13249 RepID=T1HMX1_RHOPR